MALVIRTSFVAGATGRWRRIVPVIGATLAPAQALSVFEGNRVPGGEAAWTLRGVTSNERYVTQGERRALSSKQQPLGRAEATRAALIAIRKSEAWWELTQDARRNLFEERSHHIAIGLTALPEVARRLHHGRDLGEPFDFVTWFEFAPEHAERFDEVLNRLRASEEWRYVEREVEVRLSRPLDSA